MPPIKYTGDALWERIERAVEIVKDRLRRVTQTLEGAGVPYAVVGGNAVQMWVAQVDESVVRNTRYVDIALNRADLPAATKALEAAGLVFRQAAGGARVHVRDMLSIGLIDASWLPRLAPELQSRLQELIDDPDG